MDKEFKCLWKQFNWTNLKPDFVVRNVILSGTINNQIFQCNFRYDPRTVVTLVCKTPVSKHVTFWRIIFIRIKSDYSESTGKKSNRTNKQTPLTETASLKALWEKRDQGRFPIVRTGQPDHGRTRHFGNEIGFFQEVLLKNNNLLCIISRIWLIWMVSFD